MKHDRSYPAINRSGHSRAEIYIRQWWNSWIADIFHLMLSLTSLKKNGFMEVYTDGWTFDEIEEILDFACTH